MDLVALGPVKRVNPLEVFRNDPARATFATDIVRIFSDSLAQDDYPAAIYAHIFGMSSCTSYDVSMVSVHIYGVW